MSPRSRLAQAPE